MLKQTLPTFLASLLLAFAAHAAETTTPTPKESNNMKPTIIEEDIPRAVQEIHSVYTREESVEPP